MLKMSPFLTFLLYCLFVSFTIYYLTKDKLDETSRYGLIAVLILPYIFMDQSESFSNMVKENVENYSSIDPIPKIEIAESIAQKFEQPKINLSQDEQVENLKAIEEINTRKKLEDENRIKKIVDEIKNKTFTFDEVKSLINASKSNNKTVETYGSMYVGDVKNEYNEDEKFTSQLLKPLGQNGNGLTNSWDHDYILLNTDKWGPALNPPPVCKTEKTCPVCPNLTTGYPLMVRDFDNTRRITPPIKADIPSMNATSSENPTNATDGNDVSSPPKQKSNEVNITPNILSIMKSVPKADRPALISEFAKQFNIPETPFKAYINAALEESAKTP